MILITKEDSSSLQKTFLICLTDSVSEATFLRRAKVRTGTYAADLMSELYRAVFRRSLELKTDYSKYFAKEYTTFGEYVRTRFRFSDAIIKQVEDIHSVVYVIYYYESGLHFLTDEYGRDFLIKLLEPIPKERTE